MIVFQFQIQCRIERSQLLRLGSDAKLFCALKLKLS